MYIGAKKTEKISAIITKLIILNAQNAAQQKFLN